MTFDSAAWINRAEEILGKSGFNIEVANWVASRSHRTLIDIS